MIRCLIILLLVSAAALSSVASEPFIGTVFNTKGKPIRGINVYIRNPNDVVKSDKNGEFRLNEIAPTDSIHIVYKKCVHSLAVNGRSDMLLVVGDDGRIFEKDNYVGETFHGHIIDYRGKPIRGAVIYANDPFDYVKSDHDGKFLIDNIVETDTLHIKHDGYIHDVAMDGSKGMFIKIMRTTGRRFGDEDEVNIGVGKVKLRDYNGPYSKLTAKQLEATGESDLLMALKRVPGIGFNYRDKKMILSIRNSMWPPLWVVDGLEMTEIPDLTVMEVENVVVLKDGAGYGTRAAGGVIVVTTKGSTPEFK